jgi:hypothetical protein
MTTPAAFTWYCTGRGTHDRTGLPAVVTRPVPGRSITVVPQCPVCGLGSKTIGWHVLQKPAAAGITEVDISRLPF